MRQEKETQMRMAIYEAINAVAQQYARYHASRITSASRLCDTDPADFTAEEQAAWREFTHWQDSYEQSEKRQKTLWGYISAGFYRQVQPLLDELRKELLP